MNELQQLTTWIVFQFDAVLYVGSIKAADKNFCIRQTKMTTDVCARIFISSCRERYPRYSRELVNQC